MLLTNTTNTTNIIDAVVVGHHPGDAADVVRDGDEGCAGQVLAGDALALRGHVHVPEAAAGIPRAVL